MLLTHVGTVSVGLFTAGISILVSTSERRAVTAVRQTVGLAMVWCILPSMLQILVPRLSPRVWYWIRDCNEWWLASSPVNVAETLLRLGIGSRLFDSIMWMIGLELAAGCAFVAWSVARLRRASRKVEEGGGGKRGLARLWPTRPLRLLGRSPCGANPVLWKEVHTSRAPGIVDVIGAIVAVGVVGLIGFGTFHFARPAFIELSQHGYGGVAQEPRRAELNRFLSHVSSWVEFLMLLIVAGVAAVSVTLERARDTWDSLIATPLDGREILRAKMIGAVWKVRAGAFLLLVLWSIGLLAGSLHPVGFGAAVILLGVSMWFMAALGTFASLVSRDTSQASNRALIPALLLSGSFLLCYVPSRLTTVFMGLGSAPFVNWVCLVSSTEIRDVMSGDDTFRRLEYMNIYSYEGALSVLVACLVSIGVCAVAAICLSRAAFNRFDHVVGRPQRATNRSAPRFRSWLQLMARRRKTVAIVAIVAVFLISQIIASVRVARSLRDALAERPIISTQNGVSTTWRPLASVFRMRRTAPCV